MASDPQELNNLAGERGGDVLELRAVLRDWKGRTAAVGQELQVPMDEESIENLRELGYIQ